MITVSDTTARKAFEGLRELRKGNGIEVKQSLSLPDQRSERKLILRTPVYHRRRWNWPTSLGYPYTISGHVVDGEHTGRKLVSAPRIYRWMTL